MPATTSDHDQIMAMEWMIEKLAIAYCLDRDDPIAAAKQLQKEGVEYADLMFKFALGRTDLSKAERDNMTVTALGIGSSISLLTEAVVQGASERA